MIGLPYPACSSSTTPPPARWRPSGCGSPVGCPCTCAGRPSTASRISATAGSPWSSTCSAGTCSSSGWTSPTSPTSPTSRTRSSTGPPPRACPVRVHRRQRGPVVGGHGRPRRAPARRDPPRHRLRGADGRPGGGAGGTGGGLRDRRRRLPVGDGRARLRAPGPPAPRLPSVRGPGRGRRGEALAPRLRAVEEGQEGRALLEVAVGSGPAGVAHRVRGDVPRPAGRRLRPARRWSGPHLPAPRERAGPGGGGRTRTSPVTGSTTDG